MNNRISMPEAGNFLGNYLKDRRARLDPAAFGFKVGRRRTPGLRREEVAQRSNISPTGTHGWSRDGAALPPRTWLNRIAGALMLTDVEREHLLCSDSGAHPRFATKLSKA